MILKPIAEQAEQCALVEQELIETINRLILEGIDARIVIAGVATATASAIHSLYGAAKVPAWFAQQSAMTMHLAKQD